MQYLQNIIGQENVKTRLGIYGKSYKKSGVLPFLLVISARGYGKTKLIREFRKTLEREDGSRPPILEVNASTIKSADQFLLQVFDTWKDNDACLFLDECHALPPKLAELFLTVLEKDANPVRRITFNHKDGPFDYEFDFTKMSIVMATTNHEKLSKPLNDRLTKICLEGYSDDNLFQIFKNNCKTKIDPAIEKEIKMVFRGHPRNCVELADNLDHYAAAFGHTIINKENWDEFTTIMGIHNFGLDEAELRILRLLGERGPCSLNAIAATTGYSRSVVQNEYEHALLGRGLMEINQQRCLTRKGREFYMQLARA
jgi:Holliday junction DNA helicase RuvB